MNLTKILAGTILATNLLYQGCVSNMGSRMYDICMPLSNVPTTESDLEAKATAREIFIFFNEHVKDSLETVDFRIVSEKELDNASGKYVFLNGGIIFIKEGLDETYFKEVVFHELIHRLDCTGKIDRVKFFSIYDNIDMEKFSIKRRIEEILNSKEYLSSFWKDPQSERIAYCFALWHCCDFDLPDEMVDFAKTILDNDFVENKRKGLYIANK